MLEVDINRAPVEDVVKARDLACWNPGGLEKIRDHQFLSIKADILYGKPKEADYAGRNQAAGEELPDVGFWTQKSNRHPNAAPKNPQGGEQDFQENRNS